MKSYHCEIYYLEYALFPQLYNTLTQKHAGVKRNMLCNEFLHVFRSYTKKLVLHFRYEFGLKDNSERRKSHFQRSKFQNFPGEDAPEPPPPPYRCCGFRISHGSSWISPCLQIKTISKTSAVKYKWRMTFEYEK